MMVGKYFTKEIFDRGYEMLSKEIFGVRVFDHGNV
jgi:hypothetical protein